MPRPGSAVPRRPCSAGLGLLLYNPSGPRRRARRQPSRPWRCARGWASRGPVNGQWATAQAPALRELSDSFACAATARAVRQLTGFTQSSTPRAQRGVGAGRVGFFSHLARPGVPGTPSASAP